MNQELNIPEYFKAIPIKALRMSSRTAMAMKLNKETIYIDNDVGVMNNYIGLAELIGLSNEQIQSIAVKENPTFELFEVWKQSLQLTPTLGKLWKCLLELKRFDVLTDCRKAIEKDVECYRRQQENQVEVYATVQQQIVSSRDDHHVNETCVLTSGDVTKGVPQYYDAFVCYSQSEKDVLFVKDLVQKLEVERGVKLCVPGRDDLPGGTRYTVDAKLIRSRCRMMIVVLSTDYLQSPACDFQLKFAISLTPGTVKKRIVPIITERMNIPESLRHMSVCDFTNKHTSQWVLERLYRSLTVNVSASWKDEDNSESSITVLAWKQSNNGKTKTTARALSQCSRGGEQKPQYQVIESNDGITKMDYNKVHRAS